MIQFLSRVLSLLSASVGLETNMHQPACETAGSHTMLQLTPTTSSDPHVLAREVSAEEDC